MTTLEYLSIRLGNKITQVINTENIHIINGKVVTDMGKEKENAMKQPKKLTREQKQCVSAHHLNPNNWALVEETEFYYKVVNKETGKTKMLDKFRR